MKTIAAVLLSVPLLAGAVTDHEDGSVTLTKEEKNAVVEYTEKVTAQRDMVARHNRNNEEAIKYLKQELDRLKNGTCI